MKFHKYVICLLLVLVATPFAFSSTWSLTMSFGTYGNNNAEFDGPRGIATDTMGNIYVSDHNNKIQKFTDSGIFIDSFNGSSVTYGIFNLPTGMQFGNDTYLYVAECGNKRISKINSSGSIIDTFGSAGSGEGQFNCPLDIEFDSLGRLVITDFHNARIQRFYPNGTFVDTFGGGNFSKANSLAIDDEDYIYVTDHVNNKITKFNPSGAPILAFGSSGSGDGQLSNPDDLDFDNAGNLYVTDHLNNRIQIFNKNGTFLDKFGIYGTTNGSLNGPAVLLATPTGIIVGDYNNRIQIFSKVQENQTTTTTSSTTTTISTTTTTMPSSGGGGGGGPPITIPTCKAQGAAICETGLECPGKWLKSSDIERCCSMVCHPKNKTEDNKKENPNERGMDNTTITRNLSKERSGTISQEIEKAKSMVNDEQKRLELDEIAVTATDISSYIDDFQSKENNKGFVYSIKVFLGLAAKEEEKNARFLENSGSKLRSLALNMTALANELETSEARQILHGQTASLNQLANEIIKKAEEKRKVAKGIFSFLFG